MTCMEKLKKCLILMYKPEQEAVGTWISPPASENKIRLRIKAPVVSSVLTHSPVIYCFKGHLIPHVSVVWHTQSLWTGRSLMVLQQLSANKTAHSQGSMINWSTDIFIRPEVRGRSLITIYGPIFIKNNAHYASQINISGNSSHVCLIWWLQV